MVNGAPAKLPSIPPMTKIDTKMPHSKSVIGTQFVPDEQSDMEALGAFITPEWNPQEKVDNVTIIIGKLDIIYEKPMPEKSNLKSIVSID